MIANVVLGVTLLLNLFFLTIGIQGKRWSAPYFLFAILWVLILVIYFVSDWYGLTFETSIVILFGNLSFLITSYLMAFRSSSSNRAKGMDCNLTTEVNYKLLFVLCILYIVVNLNTIVFNIGFLLIGKNFNDIQLYNIQNDNINSSSSIIKILSVLVSSPFLYASLPLFALELFKSKKKWWFIVLEVIVLIFSVLSSGKRSILIYTIVVIFIVSQNKNVKLSHRRKLLIAFFISLLIAAIVFASLARDTSIIDTTASYIAGGVPSLDQRIKHVDSFYFGLGFFQGLLVPLMIGLKGMVGMSYPGWWMNLEALIAAPDYVNIGVNSSINAFNTIFYVPYIDGGIVFVIIEMSVVGSILGSAYKNFIMNMSIRSICIYSTLCIIIAGSMYTLYFTQYPFALSFIYILLLTRKTKVRRTVVMNIAPE